MTLVSEALKAGGHNPDLVKVITGFGNAGAALVACPGVATLLFTASPQVGRLVMEGASKYLKPVVLELGGKDPMVICEDANIDELIPIVLRGTYQNSGQNCCGIERVVVHEKVYEEFLKKSSLKSKTFAKALPSVLTSSMSQELRCFCFHFSLLFPLLLSPLLLSLLF